MAQIQAQSFCCCGIYSVTWAAVSDSLPAIVAEQQKNKRKCANNGNSFSLCITQPHDGDPLIHREKVQLCSSQPVICQ